MKKVDKKEVYWTGTGESLAGAKSKKRAFLRFLPALVGMGILVVLMVIFTFFDLKISQRIVNEKSVFGLIFREIGEIPIYLIIPFFVVSTVFCVKNQFIKLVLATVLPFSNYFWLEKLFGVLEFSSDQYYYLVMVAASLVFSALLIAVYIKLPVQVRFKLLRIFLVGVIFALLMLTFIQSFKMLWGRVRFASMDGDFDRFTHWYEINGENGNRSFPSGHTGAAAGMFVLLHFFKEFKIKLPVKLLMVFLAIGFIVATAVSRVILGAHFATDVTFAILLCYPLFVLSQQIVIKAHAVHLRKVNKTR